MYQIIYSQHFKRILKRLSKKNPSLTRIVEITLLSFQEKIAISIGKEIFKVRIPGWNQGKSGGYRLYIYVIKNYNTISPVFIYVKNEMESIPWKELMYHVTVARNELYQMYGWILD